MSIETADGKAPKIGATAKLLVSFGSWMVLILESRELTIRQLLDFFLLLALLFELLLLNFSEGPRPLHLQPFVIIFLSIAINLSGMVIHFGVIIVTLLLIIGDRHAQIHIIWIVQVKIIDALIAFQKVDL